MEKPIAHVPQDIFLIDQTIAENIALGIAPEEINFDKVIYAAKKAKIHEYIIKRPKGYNEKVGKEEFTSGVNVKDLE